MHSFLHSCEMASTCFSVLSLSLYVGDIMFVCYERSCLKGFKDVLLFLSLCVCM